MTHAFDPRRGHTPTTVVVPESLTPQQQVAQARAQVAWTKVVAKQALGRQQQRADFRRAMGWR